MKYASYYSTKYQAHSTSGWPNKST